MMGDLTMNPYKIAQVMLYTIQAWNKILESKQIKSIVWLAPKS